MNGHYTETTAEEALKLAKSTAAELDHLKDTMRSLVAWLYTELGEHNARTLLNRLAAAPKEQPNPSPLFCNTVIVRDGVMEVEKTDDGL